MAVVTISSKLATNGLQQHLHAEASVVQEACTPPGQSCDCAGEPCYGFPGFCCPGYICEFFTCVPI